MRRVDRREMPLDSGLPVSGRAARLGNEFAEISRVARHLEATACCDYAIGLPSESGARQEVSVHSGSAQCNKTIGVASDVSIVSPPA